MGGEYEGVYAVGEAADDDGVGGGEAVSIRKREWVGKCGRLFL